jgi:hypothetical protein
MPALLLQVEVVTHIQQNPTYIGFPLPRLRRTILEVGRASATEMGAHVDTLASDQPLQL